MAEDDALVFKALQHFVAMYNRSHRSQLHFVERLQPGQQQPPEPDALCLLDGKQLGVEVAHLYGTGQDAERITGAVQKRRNPLTEEERMDNRLKAFRERVLAELNTKVLGKKAKKRYRRSPVWLLVRNRFPLCNRQYFEQHMDEIIVPEDHPFEHIWLLGEHDGGLLQLR